MNSLKFSGHVIVEKGFSPYIFAKCIEVAKITLEIVNALTSHFTVTDRLNFFLFLGRHRHFQRRGHDAGEWTAQKDDGKWSLPRADHELRRSEAVLPPQCSAKSFPWSRVGLGLAPNPNLSLCHWKGVPYLPLAAGVLELDIA